MFMFGTSLIFILFLPFFYAQDPIRLYDSSIKTEEEAAKQLVEIKFDQALPLILFLEEPPDASNPMFNVLKIPKDLNQVTAVGGRMVKGTQFLNFSRTQIFFCPKQDSQEKCLAPQNFNESQILECGIEPIPVVNSNQTKGARCGSGKTGTLHNIAYKICPMDSSYEYETKEISFYEFCYNKSKRSTLYTSHVILSPKLLRSNLLLRERGVEYPFVVDGFNPSNLDKITQKLNLIDHPEKSSYKLQMLVPEADMALGLWRKTTYRNFNLEWQHKKLIPLWNQINDFIRFHALVLFEHNIEILVRTGVIDIDPVSQNDAEMSNIWVTMITSASSNIIRKPRGVAILMNNFIQTATENSSTDPNPTAKAIESFCTEDVCASTLHDQFKAVGGRIRCCKLIKANEKVRNLFGVIKDSDIDNEYKLFKIPNVSTNPKKIPFY